MVPLFSWAFILTTPPPSDISPRWSVPTHSVEAVSVEKMLEIDGFSWRGERGRGAAHRRDRPEYS